MIKEKKMISKPLNRQIGQIHKYNRVRDGSNNGRANHNFLGLLRSVLRALIKEFPYKSQELTNHRLAMDLLHDQKFNLLRFNKLIQIQQFYNFLQPFMQNNKFRQYIGTLKGREQLGMKKGKIKQQNLNYYYHVTYHQVRKGFYKKKLLVLSNSQKRLKKHQQTNENYSNLKQTGLLQLLFGYDQFNYLFYLQDK